jgi:uncharacterized membrane protein YkoI
MIENSAAIEIARRRAAEKGWAFAEPIAVRLRRGWFGGADRYEIETNANNRGTKARFVIDAATGAIVSEGYISR